MEEARFEVMGGFGRDVDGLLCLLGRIVMEVLYLVGQTGSPLLKAALSPRLLQEK